MDHTRAFTEGYIPLSSRSQTGYIPISDSSETFYWFFHSDHDYSTKPILVWLQGQIGVTSLVGALIEFNPEWTKNFNLLFVDAPVGVGFSTTRSQSDLATTSEEIASQLITFLEHFFARYNNFRDPQVIIAGEDYAGHTIPLIVNLGQNTPHLPFKILGMAVGNGHTHAPIQVITKADSATIFGLLDTPECISSARSHAWRASVLSVIGDSLGSLDQRNLLEQTILNCSRDINMANVGQFVSQASVDPAFSKVERWLNDSEHLVAIGVDPRIRLNVKNSTVFENLKGDIMRVIWGHIPPILDAGITTLWYQGQLDWVDGVYSNEAWLNALDWSGSDQYAQTPRSVWEGGYLRSYGPLNEAMILGAGHLALVDKPHEMLSLFKRIFFNESIITSLPEEALVV